ncbi:hypothetical protein RB597_010254 [Gaeumannomyces tritici]
MAQARFYCKSTDRRKFTLSQPSPYDPYSSLANTLPCLPDALMHDVEVRLFTFDAAANHFIVYSASIGADFLEGFAQPSQRLYQGPEGASSVRVFYTRVPVRPLYGLKKRLGKALGPGITGSEFLAAAYDTFHTHEEPPLYVDQESRYRECQPYRREEQQPKLRQPLSKSLDGDSKKRSRESSRGSDNSGGGDGHLCPRPLSGVAVQA